MGGYSQPSQNSKCQDLPKFQFSGVGGGWGGVGRGVLYCSESGALSEF